MQHRRLLPDHLTVNGGTSPPAVLRSRSSLRASLILAILSFGTGCVSDRYTGSVGRDGTYVNRGYGFTVQLSRLGDRWTMPAQISGFDSPIDVDGDGLIEVDETRRIRRPTLILEAKTSSASMTIDAFILGKNNKDASLEGLMLLELAQLANTSSTSTLAPSIDSRMLGTFPVLVAEAGERRLALIDVDQLIAEENQPRRQIFKVILRARELTAALREDHDLLLSAMVLSRRGGAETAQEKW